jgi:hypothetical protein
MEGVDGRIDWRFGLEDGLERWVRRTEWRERLEERVGSDRLRD